MSHEALSKSVAACCSAQHSCLYSILLNTPVRMYSDTILDRLGERAVQGVAWGNTLVREEGVGVGCNRSESMLGSIWLGMPRDMSVGAAEGVGVEEEVEVMVEEEEEVEVVVEEKEEVVVVEVEG